MQRIIFYFVLLFLVSPSVHAGKFDCPAGGKENKNQDWLPINRTKLDAYLHQIKKKGRAKTPGHI